MDEPLTEKSELAIPEFLSGGAEMAQRIRQYDWSVTSLGAVNTWPQSLRSALSICLNSNFPIAIYWGKDLTLLYNEAWSPIPGNKHPWALGKPAKEVWPEIWSAIEPQFEKAFNGVPGGSKDALLPMQRHGYTEECYFDFTFTPIYGEGGKVEGVFNAVIETTKNILNERQLKTLTELGKTLIDPGTYQEVIEDTINVLNQNPYDFPFAFFRRIENSRAILTYSTPLGKGEDFFSKEIDLRAESEIAATINKAIGTRTLQVMQGIREKIGELPKGAWDISPDKVIAVPVMQAGMKEPYGVLVVGHNPLRVLDENYARFFSLVADQMATSFTQVHVLEEERKRAEALAEVDKAKTAFFTNISHEFRTPLTLMLGTLEEALGDTGTIGRNRQRLDVTHRNAMRLLKLVNTLLDFSRIEAGKVKAKFQLTDIASFTNNLASNFRSAIENAGLGFTVLCDTVIQPVYIDKEMWEKIVLNLLSNAFKYTLEGNITLSLTTQDNQVILKVSDTGVGIPKAELPKMFQRFHRVENTTGRTFEGTGIGLSLVKELVQLHGGNIAVASEEGKGAEFTVTIPTGKAHLHPTQISDKETGFDQAIADAFLEEAAALIEQPFSKNGNGSAEAPLHLAEAATILVVDDNADMREHLKNLLQKHFKVVTASNGMDALHQLKDHKVDLVVSDIMMPIMDGIQLVKEIKQVPQTQSIPIILLSARAGEEARIEGFEIGADDYLIKPFSSKELLTRINTQINLSKLRRREVGRLKQLVQQAPVAMCVLRGPHHVIEMANGKQLEVWGKESSEVLNKPVFEALPEAAGQGFETLLEKVLNTGEPLVITEMPVQLVRFGKPETIILNFTYEALHEDDGTISGIISVAMEVTEQIEAKKIIKESEERYATTVNASDLGLWDFDVLNQKVVAAGKMAEIYGLASNEEYTLQQLFSSIHPAEVKGQQQLFDDILKSKIDSSFITEYRIIKKSSGEERWIRAKGYAFFNEEGVLYRTVGTVADITVQKMIQERLKESENRFRTMADAIPEIIWMTDTEEKAEFFNKRWEEFSGVPFELTTASEIAEKFLHPEDGPKVMAAFQKAMKTGTLMEVEQRNRSASGEYRWFLNRAMPYRDPLTGEITKWFGISTDIHNRKMIELALQESESRFQNLVHKASVGIILLMGEGMKVEIVNEAYGKLIECTPEELLGKELFTVIPETEEFYRPLIDRVRLSGEPLYLYDTAYEVKKNEKTVAGFLNVVYQPYRDKEGTITGVLVLCQDVTESVKAKRALQESESRFRTLAETLPQLVWMTNEKGEQQYASSRWKEYTGIDPTGKDTWQQMVHPEDMPLITNAWLAAMGDGNLYKAEVRLKNKQGEYRWHFVQGEPIRNEQYEIIKWIGAFTDIHEQKVIEEKLEKLIAERTKELERSNEDLQQFAHVASHDLKEPVRKIRTFSSRLRHEFEEVLPEKAKTYIDKMETAAARMYSMIEGVLLYSSVGAEEEKLRKVDLNEVLRHVETDLEMVIEQKRAIIYKEHFPVLEGSSVLLHQLFYNLLNNSLKFSKVDARPLIAITVEEISLPDMNKEERPDGKYTKILIKDNGIGFNQSYADKIFKTFARLNSKDKYEGTGLGLALCKKIVERHGGSIKAEGEEGVGATFTIVLPLKQVVN